MLYNFYFHNSTFFTLLYYSKSWPHEIILVLGIISAVTILLMTPVESKNKPLDQSERRVYKRRSIIVLFVQAVVALASEFTLPIIGFSMGLVSVMLIAAKIQQYYGNFRRQKKCCQPAYVNGYVGCVLYSCDGS